MAAEGMRVDPDDMLVTTGGQQVIDLVCKTLIDPGDVVVAEAPTYPGAVPTFSPTRPTSCRSRWTPTACASTCSRRRSTGSSARAARPKFIYTVPTFQNPAGVTLSLAAPPAARRDRAASASCSCSRTTRTGCCATRASRCRRCYALDGGEYVIYLGTFSKILSPGIRLGWAVGAAPGAARSSTSASRPPTSAPRRCTQLFVARLLRRRGDWRGLRRRAARPLPRAARRDARRAGRVLPARGDVDPARRAACSSGRRCRTTSTRPTCWRARCASNVAFVPGPRRLPRRARRLVDAAELLGRRTSDDIREGVRRIGKVVREQVELYGTLTGAPAVAAAGAGRAGAGAAGARRRGAAAAARASDGAARAR